MFSPKVRLIPSRRETAGFHPGTGFPVVQGTMTSLVLYGLLPQWIGILT